MRGYFVLELRAAAFYFEFALQRLEPDDAVEQHGSRKQQIGVGVGRNNTLPTFPYECFEGLGRSFHDYIGCFDVDHVLLQKVEQGGPAEISFEFLYLGV